MSATGLTQHAEGCNCETNAAEKLEDIRAELRESVKGSVKVWAEHTGPDDAEFQLMTQDAMDLPRETLALLLSEAVTMLAEEHRL